MPCLGTMVFWWNIGGYLEGSWAQILKARLSRPPKGSKWKKTLVIDFLRNGCDIYSEVGLQGLQATRWLLRRHQLQSHHLQSLRALRPRPENQKLAEFNQLIP